MCLLVIIPKIVVTFVELVLHLALPLLLVLNTAEEAIVTPILDTERLLQEVEETSNRI